MSLVDVLKEEEGFRAKAYSDTRGFLTIGYGTNISEGITREEASYLLNSRLLRFGHELADRWAPFDDMPTRVQSALMDMSYQLGVDGVLGFHKMLGHLEHHEWAEAKAEALDSVWDKETPRRTERVAERFLP